MRGRFRRALAFLPFQPAAALRWRALNSEVGCLVSGHGFSRAANRKYSEGFSPRLQELRKGALGLPSPGAKAQRIDPFGTAEAVP